MLLVHVAILLHKAGMQELQTSQASQQAKAQHRIEVPTSMGPKLENGEAESMRRRSLAFLPPALSPLVTCPLLEALHAPKWSVT